MCRKRVLNWIFNVLPFIPWSIIYEFDCTLCDVFCDILKLSTFFFIDTYCSSLSFYFYLISIFICLNKYVFIFVMWHFSLYLTTVNLTLFKYVLKKKKNVFMYIFLYHTKHWRYAIVIFRVIQHKSAVEWFKIILVKEGKKNWNLCSRTGVTF